MGRERSWKMEHLFLYVTGSMIMLVFMMGCAYSSSQNQKREALWGKAAVTAGLANADTAIANGDYPLALQENEEITEQYPGILEDQILYQRGRIHAHPQNPEQNFQKAIDTFRELTEKFPSSKSVIESEAWMITLKGILQKDQALSALKKDLQKREKAIAQLNKQISGHQALIRQLNNQRLQLENQVSDLETQLEKLKKVDLGIEEKKRTGTEH
jgi:outer membrane protein assembly factor BamD (BamD/ComL family)